MGLQLTFDFLYFSVISKVAADSTVTCFYAKNFYVKKGPSGWRQIKTKNKKQSIYFGRLNGKQQWNLINVKFYIKVQKSPWQNSKIRQGLAEQVCTKEKEQEGERVGEVYLSGC